MSSSPKLSDDGNGRYRIEIDNVRNSHTDKLGIRSTDELKVVDDSQDTHARIGLHVFFPYNNEAE